MNKTENKYEREYSRLMLRSSFVSLIVNCINYRRSQSSDLSLTKIARMIGKDKATLSRDLGGSPNWRSDTISDLVGALGFEIRMSAVDRDTGTIVGCTEENSRTIHINSKASGSPQGGSAQFNGPVGAESA